MGRFDRTSLPALLLLLLAAPAARCGAFAPRSARPSLKVGSVGRTAVLSTTALRESSSDDEDGSSTRINVALISAASSASDHHGELRTLLEEHPFCKMTGVKLSIADVSADTTSSWGEDDLSLLREADIACFGTASSVTSYLSALDRHFGAGDASDEERRKLPNRPDDPGEEMPTDDSASLMAACPTADAARECLNSGRWMANHIYYPKDTQGAVELRTEPLDGDGDGSTNEGEEDGDVDVDVGVWADSVIQAAGDVMERKFWGGGW